MTDELEKQLENYSKNRTLVKITKTDSREYRGYISSVDGEFLFEIPMSSKTSTVGTKLHELDLENIDKIEPIE